MARATRSLLTPNSRLGPTGALDARAFDTCVESHRSRVCMHLEHACTSTHRPPTHMPTHARLYIQRPLPHVHALHMRRRAAQTPTPIPSRAASPKVSVRTIRTFARWQLEEVIYMHIHMHIHMHSLVGSSRRRVVPRLSWPSSHWWRSSAPQRLTNLQPKMSSSDEELLANSSIWRRRRCCRCSTR